MANTNAKTPRFHCNVNKPWLIHTRCSGLQIPQWMVALLSTDGKIPISMLTQSTAESALV